MEKDTKALLIVVIMIGASIPAYFIFTGMQSRGTDSRGRVIYISEDTDNTYLSNLVTDNFLNSFGIVLVIDGSQVLGQKVTLDTDFMKLTINLGEHDLFCANGSVRIIVSSLYPDNGLVDILFFKDGAWFCIVGLSRVNMPECVGKLILLVYNNQAASSAQNLLNARVVEIDEDAGTALHYLGLLGEYATISYSPIMSISGSYCYFVPLSEDAISSALKYNLYCANGTSKIFWGKAYHAYQGNVYDLGDADVLFYSPASWAFQGWFIYPGLTTNVATHLAQVKAS